MTKSITFIRVAQLKVGGYSTVRQTLQGLLNCQSRGTTTFRGHKVPKDSERRSAYYLRGYLLKTSKKKIDFKSKDLIKSLNTRVEIFNLVGICVRGMFQALIVGGTKKEIGVRSCVRSGYRSSQKFTLQLKDR